MKIVDPNKPLDYPSNNRLTNYKTNSSKLVSNCTNILKFKTKYLMMKARPGPSVIMDLFIYYLVKLKKVRTYI